MKIRTILVAFLAVSLIACKKNNVKKGEAKYSVTFTGMWDASDHDSTTVYPVNAHFSPVIGLSHSSSVGLFSENTQASEGFKQMAETGATDLLKEELERYLYKDARDVFVFDGPITTGIGEGESEVIVSEDESYVSLVSMIAPSPDWFTGVNKVKLKPFDGDWIDEITMQLYAYDAGTDSGPSFTSPNMTTSPQGFIKMLDNSKFNSGSNTNPIVIAEVTFKLLESK